MSIDSSAYPYRTVVRITATMGGQSIQGSGVLISPDEVLTASHVVYSSARGVASNIVVTPGYSNGSAPFGSASGALIHYFKIDDGDGMISLADSQSDYAVIHLSTSFSSVGTMGLTADFAGGWVNVTGYPRSAGGAEVNSYQLVTHDPTYALLDGAAIGKGSSGGPVWTQLADGPHVVGIVSSAEEADNTGYDTLITTAALAQIQAWVAQDDAGAPGTPATRTIPTTSATPTPPATPPTAPLVLHGVHTDYTVAVNPSGGAVIIDGVSGRDGTQTPATLQDMAFADGAGRFDATGNAEAVGRLYKAAFHRAPDAVGLDYWTNLIDSRTLGLDDTAGAFVTSAEFGARTGGLTNSGFVQLLYLNVLGRPGDSDGAPYWTGVLDRGTSRAQVLAAFADSFENRDNSLPTIGDRNLSEAYRLYRAAFNRMPDTEGLRAWTTRLDQGSAPVEVAEAFAASAEFTQDFSGLDAAATVGRLYANVLHRAGDAAGVQYWAGQLSAGASRGQVLLGFADSLESRIFTAAATHDGWLFLA